MQERRKVKQIVLFSFLLDLKIFERHLNLYAKHRTFQNILGNVQIVYRFFGNQNKAKTKTKNKNRKQIKQKNKATLGYNGYDT